MNFRLYFHSIRFCLDRTYFQLCFDYFPLSAHQILMIDDLNALAITIFFKLVPWPIRNGPRRTTNQRASINLKKKPEGIHYSAFRYPVQLDSKMMNSIPIVLMLQFLVLLVHQDYFEIQIAPKFLKYGWRNSYIENVTSSYDMIHIVILSKISKTNF